MMNPMPPTGNLFRPWELRSDALKIDESRRTARVNPEQANYLMPLELLKLPDDKSGKSVSSLVKRKESIRKKCLTTCVDRRSSEEKSSDSLHHRLKLSHGTEHGLQNKRTTVPVSRVSHSSRFPPSCLDSKLSSEAGCASELSRKKRPKDKACSKCHNTFSNQAQLDAHMRGHFNVRNYGCEFIVDSVTKRKCGKRFVRKEELTRHQRTHTGEKPHLCRICSKGFGRKDHLQKHEKTHERSPQNQYQFQMTPFNFPLPPTISTPFPLIAPPRTDLLMPLSQSDLLLHSLNILSYTQNGNFHIDEAQKFPSTSARSYPQPIQNMNTFERFGRPREVNGMVKSCSRLS